MGQPKSLGLGGVGHMRKHDLIWSDLCLLINPPIIPIITTNCCWVTITTLDQTSLSLVLFDVSLS